MKALLRWRSGLPAIGLLLGLIGCQGSRPDPIPHVPLPNHSAGGGTESEAGPEGQGWFAAAFPRKYWSRISNSGKSGSTGYRSYWTSFQYRCEQTRYRRSTWSCSQYESPTTTGMACNQGTACDAAVYVAGQGIAQLISGR